MYFDLVHPENPVDPVYFIGVVPVVGDALKQ
jgi:hypothetical protein